MYRNELELELRPARSIVTVDCALTAIKLEKGGPM